MSLVPVVPSGRKPQPAGVGVLPKPPRTMEEAGLRLDLLGALVLKTLHFSGDLTGVEMANRLGVAFGVIEPSLEFLKGQGHCAIVGAGSVGGPSFRYAITNAGRNAVVQHLQQRDQYLGVAPVPLQQYCDYLEAFDRESLSSAQAVTRDDVRAAFADLVLSEGTCDEIGPAVKRGRSIFVCGAPGNGKTAIARRLRALLPGDVAIPHALEVNGNIIRMFDPTAHEPRSGPSPAANRPLARSVELDERWVLCRRPLITAGGELTLEAMDLASQLQLGDYRAPLHLLANGGLLIIDDFGRQRGAPHSLMNRWMLPLENGMDYLTLQSGFRFAVPFRALVVFTTNLKPQDLVDEAFLRRIDCKIVLGDPTPDEYAQIFEEECRKADLPFEPELVEHLLAHTYGPRRLPLRASQPHDLIGHALLLAEYRNQPRRLTRELLDAACANCFAVAPAADATVT